MSESNTARKFDRNDPNIEDAVIVEEEKNIKEQEKPRHGS
jgi:hypothetical protein